MAFNDAERLRRNAEAAATESAKRARELARQAYLYHMTRADEAPCEHDLLTAQAELHRCPEECRDWEWHVASRLVENTIGPSIPGSEQPVFLRDGKRMIVIGMFGSRHDNKVRMWDVSDGVRHLRDWEFHGRLISVAVSPDDRFIAAGARNGDLVVWDFESGDIQWTDKKHLKRYADIVMTKD